jgi:hypothetical protein
MSDLATTTVETTIRRGFSRATDPALAARELFAALDQPNISLAVFFCSPDYEREALAQALQAQFGDTPLIGCTTVGEITPLGYFTGSLTGFSLAAPDFKVATRLMSDLTNFSMTEGRTIAQGLIQTLSEKNLSLDGENTFAFLLIDGMSMREELVASALHSGLQDIALFGGSAGVAPGDPALMKTYLYHAGRFSTNSAILTLVTTRRPFVVFKTENFVPTSAKLVITEAQPAVRKVTEINGEPAALEYARLVDAQAGTALYANFAAHPAGVDLGGELYASSAVHPVGVYLGGQLYLRAMGWIGEDQSITFVCAIDEGVILTLGQEVDFIENLRQRFDALQAQLGAPELVLAFDCFSRLLAMERSGLTAQAGEIMAAHNAVGFCTYGEQFNSMHMNQTLTGVAIGRATPC